MRISESPTSRPGNAAREPVASRGPWPLRLARAAPLRKLLIFSALLGMGWWGHTYHWQLPGHDVEDRSTAPSPDLTPAPRRVRPSKAGNPAPTALPAVEFASAAAARKCGIACGRSQAVSMPRYVSANGVVDYDRTQIAQLSVRVSGVVRHVAKCVGDVVNAGDVLALVDSAEVGQAKATLMEAVASHRLEAQNAERLESIKDVVAARELLAAQAAAEVSHTRLFNAVQRLNTIGLAIRTEDVVGLSSDKLAERLMWLGLPPAYCHEEAASNLVPLLAPFAGVVTNCEIVRGESVDPAKSQYVIANLDRLWINLAVREEDVPLLRIGLPVEFTSDASEQHVDCRLSWIGTEIDAQTRTVNARAEGENPRIEKGQPDYESRRQLPVGVFGTARILVGRQPSAVVVPNTALHWQWELSREIVFVPTHDGRAFVPREVTKGVVRDGDVQIVAGLAPGESVVTDGARILSSELSTLLRNQNTTAPAKARPFHPTAPALRSDPPPEETAGISLESH
jgi:multidrug efflux pump subunit AcrA (membrane-fusion protein)